MTPVQRLREEGPLTANELDVHPRALREAPVRSVRSQNWRGGVRLFYLESHDDEEVARAMIDKFSLRERLSPRELQHRLARAGFGGLGIVEAPSRAGHHEGGNHCAGTCPRCGEQHEVPLAIHLRESCEPTSV